MNSGNNPRMQHNATKSSARHARDESNRKFGNDITNDRKLRTSPGMATRFKKADVYDGFAQGVPQSYPRCVQGGDSPYRMSPRKSGKGSKGLDADCLTLAWECMCVLYRLALECLCVMYGLVGRILSYGPMSQVLKCVVCSSTLAVVCSVSDIRYTPGVDVLVYCGVYGVWMCHCLPWVLTRMDGKTTRLILGLLFRLFASDLGVMAWGQLRGHRDVFQRSLRLRPLVEPNMSWLPEVAYCLRFGVMTACGLSATKEAVEMVTSYTFTSLLKRVILPLLKTSVKANIPTGQTRQDIRSAALVDKETKAQIFDNNTICEEEPNYDLGEASYSEIHEVGHRLGYNSHDQCMPVARRFREKRSCTFQESGSPRQRARLENGQQENDRHGFHSDADMRQMDTVYSKTRLKVRSGVDGSEERRQQSRVDMDVKQPERFANYVDCKDEVLCEPDKLSRLSLSSCNVFNPAGQVFNPMWGQGHRGSASVIGSHVIDTESEACTLDECYYDNRHSYAIERRHEDSKREDMIDPVKPRYVSDFQSQGQKEHGQELLDNGRKIQGHVVEEGGSHTNGQEYENETSFLPNEPPIEPYPDFESGGDAAMTKIAAEELGQELKEPPSNQKGPVKVRKAIGPKINTRLEKMTGRNEQMLWGRGRRAKSVERAESTNNDISVGTAEKAKPTVTKFTDQSRWKRSPKKQTNVLTTETRHLGSHGLGLDAQTSKAAVVENWLEKQRSVIAVDSLDVQIKAVTSCEGQSQGHSHGHSRENLLRKSGHDPGTRDDVRKGHTTISKTVEALGQRQGKTGAPMKQTPAPGRAEPPQKEKLSPHWEQKAPAWEQRPVKL